MKRRFPQYDLWVAEVAEEIVPRRISSELLRMFGLYGRYEEDVIWWSNGAELLVLSAEGARWVKRSAPGSELSMPGSNGLVSIDPVSGISREVASPLELRSRFARCSDRLACDDALRPAVSASPTLLPRLR